MSIVRGSRVSPGVLCRAQVAIAAGVLSLAGSGSAFALAFQDTSNLANAQQFLDFQSGNLSTGTSVTSQYANAGVTFTSAYAYVNPYATGAVYTANILGNAVSNFTPDVVQTGVFTMNFASALNGVGFALVSQPGLMTMTALLNGVVVQSATFGSTLNNPNNYFGFTGITFNQVQLSVASSDRALIVDNLATVAAVPEPETLAFAMLGAGAVLLGGRRARSVKVS